jgi:cytochrome bd-type quinol oxidase subunit 2
MTTLEIVRNSLLVLHFVGMAALLGGFLAQFRARERKIQSGMLHGAYLALITGVALVGIRYPLNDENAMYELPDNAKILVKLLVLTVIVLLAIANKKKAAVDSGTWLGIGLLSFANIVIAVFW